MLARRVELDAGEVGKVGREHFPRPLHHDLAAMARGHAAEDQDVLDGQVLAVLRDGIAQVDADRRIDLAGLRLLRRVLHRRLDLLQELCVRHVAGRVHVGVVGHHLRGEVQAALFREARGRTLAEIHGGVAAVRRPRVPRGVGVEVERIVGVLVDPAREGAVLVDVARALAAAQGNAEEAAFADHVAAGHGCDLAVIDHLDRHPTELLLRDDVEDGDHLLLVDIRRHVRKAVAPRGLAVGGHGAGRAAADGLHGPRQLRGGVLHRLDDKVVVVLRVRVRHVPLRLSRVNHLAVLDRHGLDIALAEIERDAVAAGDLACVNGPLLALRQARQRLHRGDAPLRPVDLRHGADLEVVFTPGRVGLRHLLAELLRAEQGDLVPAALPQHVADRLAGQEDRGVEALVALRENRELVAAAAVGPLHSEVEVVDLAVLCAVRDALEILPLA
mmetsp:Transcript_53549/g.154394  ORF Transcript_53549/g.154394 Transcript_53549/m.154394 type:complete len:444 (+) Transcript_53549:143-1474(+)